MGWLDRWRRRAPRSEGLPDERSELWAQGVALEDAALLAEWRWLVAPRFQPVFCTALGDLFLQDHDGVVFWLDVGQGALVRAASGAEALDEAAKDVERFELWFRPDELRAAQRRTRPLATGECYSYATAPRLGGRADERTPRLALEHFAAHGRAFGPK